MFLRSLPTPFDLKLFGSDSPSLSLRLVSPIALAWRSCVVNSPLHAWTKLNLCKTGADFFDNLLVSVSNTRYLLTYEITIWEAVFLQKRPDNHSWTFPKICHELLLVCHLGAELLIRCLLHYLPLFLTLSFCFFRLCGSFSLTCPVVNNPFPCDVEPALSLLLSCYPWLSAAHTRD